MFLESKVFHSVIASTPLVSIDLVVENECDEYLLGKRVNRPAQGFWFVPGGRILKNEPISKAFSRLTLNELGQSYCLACAEFLGVYEHFYSDSVVNADVSTHYVAIAYKIKVNIAQLKLPDIQHSDYRCLNKSELLLDQFVHEHSKWYFE